MREFIALIWDYILPMSSMGTGLYKIIILPPTADKSLYLAWVMLGCTGLIISNIRDRGK